jgi:hypothetical protein
MASQGCPSALAGANDGGPLSASTERPVESWKRTNPVARSTSAEDSPVLRVTVPGASLTVKPAASGFARTIRLAGRLNSGAGASVTRMIPSP